MLNVCVRSSSPLVVVCTLYGINASGRSAPCAGVTAMTWIVSRSAAAASAAVSSAPSSAARTGDGAIASAAHDKATMTRRLGIADDSGREPHCLPDSAFPVAPGATRARATTPPGRAGLTACTGLAAECSGARPHHGRGGGGADPARSTRIVGAKRDRARRLKQTLHWRARPANDSCRAAVSR